MKETVAEHLWLSINTHQDLHVTCSLRCSAQLLNTSLADQVQGTKLSKCIPEAPFTPPLQVRGNTEKRTGEERGEEIDKRKYYPFDTVEHPNVYKSCVSVCVCWGEGSQCMDIVCLCWSNCEIMSLKKML